MTDFSERLGPFIEIETDFLFGVSPTYSLRVKYCDKLVVTDRLITLHKMPSIKYASGKYETFTGMPLHIKHLS